MKFMVLMILWATSCTSFAESSAWEALVASAPNIQARCKDQLKKIWPLAVNERLPSKNLKEALKVLEELPQPASVYRDVIKEFKATEPTKKNITALLGVMSKVRCPSIEVFKALNMSFSAAQKASSEWKRLLHVYKKQIVQTENPPTLLDASMALVVAKSHSLATSPRERASIAKYRRELQSQAEVITEGMNWKALESRAHRADLEKFKIEFFKELEVAAAYRQKLLKALPPF